MEKKKIGGLVGAYASIYEGYGKKEEDCVDKDKKIKHNCAKKVCHESFGEGTCIPEHHTLLEDGTVTHYDVQFKHGIEKMVPVEQLEILVSEMHEHAAMEGEQIDESDIGDRARRVVGDQRQGVHGDADAMKQDMDAINLNLLRLRPYGVKGFPSVKKDTKKTTQVAHFEPNGDLLDEEGVTSTSRDFKKGENKPPSAPTLPPPSKSKPKPKPTRTGGGPGWGFGIYSDGTFRVEDVVIFDLVKSYLIKEGYVKNEKAAASIIQNMGENWKNEIVQTILEGDNLSYKDATAILKDHSYSRQQLMNMSKKATSTGQHGLAQACYDAACKMKGV